MAQGWNVMASFAALERIGGVGQKYNAGGQHLLGRARAGRKESDAVAWQRGQSDEVGRSASFLATAQAMKG